MTDLTDLTDPNLPPSLWQLKPWWCQPWSIVLTGVALPPLAWVLTQRWWIVLPVGLGVLGWWFLFLYLAPKQYAEIVRSQPPVSG